MCRTSHVTAVVYLAPSMPGEDNAAAAVEHVLGADARLAYRRADHEFPSAFEGRYFSVSHTAATTVIAVARAPIGVDIEDELSPSACRDLAWALSEHERTETRDVADHRLLTEIWTAKEAAGKAVGVGLRPGPREIETTPAQSAAQHRQVMVPNGSVRARAGTCGVWIGCRHVRVAWLHSGTE